MNTTKYPAATTLAASILTIALAAPALAAKGGNGKPGGGGGGGGGDGGGSAITINPVPDLMTTPPVTYTKTELHWSGDLNENGIADDTEASFGGIAILGVNNQGVAAGATFGPVSADPTINEKRVAVVRLDPTSAEVTPLDTVFATALQAFNSGRPATEEDWRIAYAGRINDDGKIACRLIPASAPRRFERNDAIELGIDPTPVLYAVADLSQSAQPGALMPVPISTSPDGDFLDMNELGDVLMFDHDPVANTYLARLFPLAQDNSGTLGYHLENEVSIPELTSWPVNRQSINAAREVIFRRDSQLVRYESLVAEETVLVGSGEYSWFLPNGIANDGTAFITATETVTTGKGRNKTNTYLDFPVHVISPTERTPLTNPASDGKASIPHFAWSVSRAAAPGEVEVMINLEDTGVYQIYKPKLGARFTLPITPSATTGSIGWPDISPPVDQSVTTDWDAETQTGTYAAGFISYTVTEDRHHAFVLAPNAQ